ncbi:hypothetical protein BKA63DRAFT_258553 [Paraphoma chrysanthemicola]|nr:hypothetical protein BKA63DRAFT_258553 [Paraphoma chrysanthemicola]
MAMQTRNKRLPYSINGQTLFPSLVSPYKFHVSLYCTCSPELQPAQPSPCFRASGVAALRRIRPVTILRLGSVWLVSVLGSVWLVSVLGSVWLVIRSLVWLHELPVLVVGIKVRWVDTVAHPLRWVVRYGWVDRWARLRPAGSTGLAWLGTARAPWVRLLALVRIPRVRAWSIDRWSWVRAWAWVGIRWLTKHVSSRNCRTARKAATKSIDFSLLFLKKRWHVPLSMPHSARHPGD